MLICYVWTFIMAFISTLQHFDTGIFLQNWNDVALIQAFKVCLANFYQIYSLIDF